MYRYLFIFFLVALGCSGGEFDAALDNTDIHPEFKPYVESFIREADERNIRIRFDVSGLNIQFGVVKEATNGLGFCDHATTTIKILESAWQQFSDNYKEEIIFHELGHCKLRRSHIDDLLPSDEVASIMSPSLSGVLFGDRRDYYLNELFRPNTSIPSWSFISDDYADFSELSREVDSNNINQLDEQIEIDQDRNFQIEFQIQNAEEDKVGISIGGDDLSKNLFITTRAPSQFVVETGQDLYGRVHNDPFTENMSSDKNKITIRKEDNKYFFFVNEHFVYWLDHFSFDNNSFYSFRVSEDGTVNRDAEVKIDYFRISYF